MATYDVGEIPGKNGAPLEEFGRNLDAVSFKYDESCWADGVEKLDQNGACANVGNSRMDGAAGGCRTTDDDDGCKTLQDDFGRFREC